jgi:hypothetical protein
MSAFPQRRFLLGALNLWRLKKDESMAAIHFHPDGRAAV